MYLFNIIGGIDLESKKRKCLVIYNPMSGRGMDDTTIMQYQKILKERGYYVDFIATSTSHHATEIMVNADAYDIVFSVGGDGTLNEVVKGNFLRDERLTICPLPSGTCNDVASMLGYGKDIIDNLVMALEGEIKDIDIGTVNDDPFAYVVGMGTLMNIPYETSSIEKRKMGYLAYLKAGLGTVLKKMRRYKAEITVDGMSLDGQYSLIMISNANHIAGIDDFHKDVCLDDGKLEVLLCNAKNKIAFIKDLLLYLVGSPFSAVKTLKAEDITIKLLEQPENEWCVDGERYISDGNIYHIRISDKMKFLTPKAKVKKLFKCNKKILSN